MTVLTTTLPAGLQQTSLALAGGDFGNQTMPYSITLAAGAENLTADFGFNWGTAINPPADAVGAIGDRIWIDSNGNGIQDAGEPGLGGITVAIYSDPDGDGVYDTPYTSALDQNGVISATTTTEADGSYIFSNLPAGGYVVKVLTPPAGYSQTGDPDHFASSGAENSTGNDNQTTQPIVLAPGDLFLNADFGYQPTTANTIGDTIYFDANANGLLDGSDYGGDYGIPGVSVTLLDSNGNSIATTFTDSNGNYLFTGLPDGTYTVWVNDNNNLLVPLVQSGDPDALLDSRSVVTVAGGQSNLQQDFGYTPSGHSSTLGLIGDTIWLNPDGNSTQDAGEPGIEGVVVTLTLGDGSVLTTTTDENGHYAFGSLPAGTYTITVIAPAGLAQNADPDATLDLQSVVTLSAGQVRLDQDFGLVGAGPVIEPLRDRVMRASQVEIVDVFPSLLCIQCL